MSVFVESLRDCTQALESERYKRNLHFYILMQFSSGEKPVLVKITPNDNIVFVEFNDDTEVITRLMYEAYGLGYSEGSMDDPTKHFTERPVSPEFHIKKLDCESRQTCYEEAATSKFFQKLSEHAQIRFKYLFGPPDNR
jgi:hypothetical protein